MQLLLAVVFLANTARILAISRVECVQTHTDHGSYSETMGVSEQIPSEPVKQPKAALNTFWKGVEYGKRVKGSWYVFLFNLWLRGQKRNSSGVQAEGGGTNEPEQTCRQKNVRPFHAVRLGVRSKNPGSRSSRASLRTREFHPSKIGVGSGRPPRFPDSYYVNWVQRRKSNRFWVEAGERPIWGSA